MRIANVNLKAIIRFAYQLGEHQLVDAPEWTGRTKFDIAAVYPPNTDPARERFAMLRTLLEDRFRLRSHRETREVAVYRIVLDRADGRLGSQLVPSSRDCARWFAEGQPNWPVRKSLVTPTGDRRPCSLEGAPRFISGGTQPISALADMLGVRLQRPVVDATGLSGNFDIDLQWTPDPALPPGVVDSGAMFTAIREQLGLRLQPARAPLDVLVIDSVERPTPN